MASRKPPPRPKNPNGPYHWGNGPHPKKGCAVTALALAGGLATAGYGAVEALRAVL